MPSLLLLLLLLSPSPLLLALKGTELTGKDDGAAAPRAAVVDTESFVGALNGTVPLLLLLLPPLPLPPLLPLLLP